jgi:hypothetical protein
MGAVDGPCRCSSHAGRPRSGRLFHFTQSSHHVCHGLYCLAKWRPLCAARKESFSEHQSREFGVYRGAIEMFKSYSALARPDVKVMLWFLNDEYSLGSIASTVLMFTLQVPFEQHGGEPKIGAYERSRLQFPGVRYVMMLSMSSADRERRVRALQNEGLAVREVSRWEIGDSGFRAALEVVELLGSAARGFKNDDEHP